MLFEQAQKVIAEQLKIDPAQVKPCLLYTSVKD